MQPEPKQQAPTQQENQTNPRARPLDVAGAFLKLGALSYGGPAIFGLLQADL